MTTALELLSENKPTLTQLVLVNMAPGSTELDAQRVALKEISNFETIVQLKPDLAGCTPLSVLLAVKQTICDNLTLAPSAGLVYLIPSKVNNDWVATYLPTANGLLSMAYQSGAILDNKRPVLTFDGEGKVETVTVEFLVPSYPQPRWEAITFGKTHFKKWMDASAAKNKGTANRNYTSWNGGIDPEFAGTKAIRHGLNKRGSNANAPRKTDNGTIKFEPATAIEKDTQEFTHAEVIQSTTNVSQEDLA